MRLLLLGASVMASLTVALFFLRFCRDTGDRFFFYFAAAFAVEGMNRAALGLSAFSAEMEPLLYLARLFSFLLILIAIANKNRRKRFPSRRTERTDGSATH
jgi:hypothetical protein